MAIHHVQITSYSRSDGKDAVGRSAYRSGSKMTDERTKKEYDFRGKEHITHSEMIFPLDFPADAPREREPFWNWVESQESRSNANTTKEIQFSLPIELPAEVRQELARTFATELVSRYGFGGELNIHSDPGNPHAHLQVSTRRLKNGKLEKVRELDTLKSGEVAWIRDAWADRANAALAANGSDARIYSSKEKEQAEKQQATPAHLAQAETMIKTMQEDNAKKNLHLKSHKMQVANKSSTVQRAPAQQKGMRQ